MILTATLAPATREPAALTRRENQILRALTAYQATHGFAPAIREVGRMVGLLSPSTVTWYLNALERKGYIRRVRHRPRAITVVVGGETAEHRPTPASAGGVPAR